MALGGMVVANFVRGWQWKAVVHRLFNCDWGVVRAVAINPGGRGRKYRYFARQGQIRPTPHHRWSLEAPIRPASPATTQALPHRCSNCTTTPLPAAPPQGAEHTAPPTSRCSPVAPAPWAWPNPTKVHESSPARRSVPADQTKKKEEKSLQKQKERPLNSSVLFSLLLPHSAIYSFSLPSCKQSHHELYES